MSTIWSGLTRYAENWQVKGLRKFNSDEIDAVASNKIVPSQYGLSVCFFMKAGGQVYIPLSRDSRLEEGDSINMSKATILTLGKSGEMDIMRIAE